MKKLNIFCLFCFFFCLLTIGCKSVPMVSKIKALDLLDDQSSFYIAIPYQADPELVYHIISENISDLTDNEIKQLTQRIDKIYCGLNRSRNRTQIQIAVDGTIPSKIVNGQLSKNKKTVKYSYKTKQDNSYQIFQYDGLDLCIPNNNLVCLGRDIFTMLDFYEQYRYVGIDNDIEQINPILQEELYDFLLAANNQISFYANKPQSFLTLLTGTQLDLKLNYVKGSFLVDEKNPDQYILDLDFNFKNDKYLKAGKALLTLAFSLTGSSNFEIIENDFIIKGAKLKKQQLYKIFVI